MPTSPSSSLSSVGKVDVIGVRGGESEVASESVTRRSRRWPIEDEAPERVRWNWLISSRILELRLSMHERCVASAKVWPGRLRIWDCRLSRIDVCSVAEWKQPIKTAEADRESSEGFDDAGSERARR